MKGLYQIKIKIIYINISYNNLNHHIIYVYAFYFTVINHHNSVYSMGNQSAEVRPSTSGATMKQPAAKKARKSRNKSRDLVASSSSSSPPLSISTTTTTVTSTLSASSISSPRVASLGNSGSTLPSQPSQPLSQETFECLWKSIKCMQTPQPTNMTSAALTLVDLDLNPYYLYYIAY